MSRLSIIRPDWPSPSNVHAFTTTRFGGFSQAPFDEFNLGAFAGEDVATVKQNRALLNALLPQAPFWIKQVHATHVVMTQGSHEGIESDWIEADASFTNTPHTVLSILAADCMQVLFTNESGTAVAAAHAGWRGLCGGVLENTVAYFLRHQTEKDSSRLMAWIGPSISAKHYEVGAEVRDAFIESAKHHSFSLDEQCFMPVGESGSQKYLADLPRIARARLQALGIDRVYGGDICTYSDPRFYSYRRANPTGRFASLIWLNPKP
jgi:YfiH family protein